jgi:hypothetical protein
MILHESYGKACTDIAGTANKSNLHARGIILPLFYSFARISKALGEPGVLPEENVADSGQSPGQKRYKWI